MCKITKITLNVVSSDVRFFSQAKFNIPSRQWGCCEGRTWVINVTHAHSYPSGFPQTDKHRSELQQTSHLIIIILAPPHTTSFLFFLFLSFQHDCVYLTLCPDGKCDCYTNKLDCPEQTTLSDCVERERAGEQFGNISMYSRFPHAHTCTSVSRHNITSTFHLFHTGRKVGC